MKWNAIISVVLVEVFGGVDKCCRPEEVLRQVGISFECVDASSKTVQVRVDGTDFLRNNKSGQCLDSLGTEPVILSVESGKTSYERAEGSFFPKCCPLDHVYSTVQQGCIKNPNTPDFFNETFVKVGLANCKLVIDTILNVNYDVEKESSYPGSYCIDKTENDSLVRRDCQESLRACEGIRCVKKCCPDGQSFVNGPRCLETYKHGLNLSAFGNIVEKPNDPLAIIYNTTCKKIYRMTPDLFNFSLDKYGVFTEFLAVGNNTDEVGDLHSYCIEHLENRDEEGYLFFYCFPEEDGSLTKFDYTFWPLVMSCFFLALTIFVYVVQNETKKMFGKILVNYCAAMLFSYGLLTYAQLERSPTIAECEIKAFAIIFFATASFTWSNIMCCDIWCTFGSTRRYVGTTQRKMDLTKLFLYSLYGWGVPLLLTLVIYIFYVWKVLPYSIQPFLAEVKCFFDNKRDNYAKDLFYSIPLLIIQVVNMVLFIKTVIYCLEVKNEINRINDTSKNDKMRRYRSDRERLFLILKLLVIMGISYIFEVVSSFFEMDKMGPVAKYIEIIWDTINALQGVFIFVIFICKRRIIHGCLQKFKIVERQPSYSSSFHTQSSLNLNGVSLNQMGHINKAFR